MDISKANCPDCHQPLKISRMACAAVRPCRGGEFRFSVGPAFLEDQAFVMAFVRSHGSIKKMGERVWPSAIRR